ncbi:MAG: hypothetical protein HWE07_15685 [Cytophagia bacterium]|nr:hypothetical protein [Cytophagia bacterium]
MARKNKKGRFASPSGGFANLPRVVLASADYVQLSFSAKALLVELAQQYRGSNNGDLTAAEHILKKRGFRSKTTILKAINELIRFNLVVKTRQGKFLNPGGVCSLYALTWLPIDECNGKHDMKPTIGPYRKFRLPSS